MRRPQAPLSHLLSLRQSIKQIQRSPIREACHTIWSCIRRCGLFLGTQGMFRYSEADSSRIYSLTVQTTAPQCYDQGCHHV